MAVTVLLMSANLAFAYNDTMFSFSSIPELIQEAKLGRIFIMIDEEDRENEGDLIIPAQFATPEIINFMITHARGILCLTITQEIADRLNLSLQNRSNVDKEYTAFTTSIDAAHGITTGVSASERATTIAVAINKNSNSSHIKTPGHVFPIIAHKDGLLKRRGHTEASIEISRLAGLIPSAVLCEVLSSDGEVARTKGLIEFAIKHNIKIGTVKDLVDFIS